MAVKRLYLMNEDTLSTGAFTFAELLEVERTLPIKAARCGCSLNLRAKPSYCACLANLTCACPADYSLKLPASGDDGAP